MKIIHKKHHNRGFTLVELLISMTITLVIIGVLMAMTRVAVSGVTNARNATKFSKLGQEVLNTVSKDLEGIVIKSGNDFEWVEIEDGSDSSTDLGPDGAKISNPINISFFSAATDRYNGNIGGAEDRGGDISMIRYKLAYQNTIDTNDNLRVFSLYRKRIEPDETFQNYLGQTNLPAFDDALTGNDLVAENIYDITISFNFEVIASDGSVTYRRVPVQANGTDKSLSIKGNEVSINGRILNNARLASADISILALSDEGMKEIINTAKIGKSIDNLALFLKRHGKHYSQSVFLPRP